MTDIGSLLQRAHAPYSNHPVAAVAQVVTLGTQCEFVGVNVENVINRLSVCAEQALISNIVSCCDGYIIVSVEVYGPDARYLEPCGACRQLLTEHCEQWTTINGKTISEWLPDAPDIDV